MSKHSLALVQDTRASLPAALRADLPPIRVPLVRSDDPVDVIKSVCRVTVDAEDINVDYTSATADFSLNIKWSALKGLFS